MYVCIHVYIYLLILSSDAGSPDAIGRHLMTPVIGCRSGAVGRRMLLCRRSGFGWTKPLYVARQPPLLVQVSTHRHKVNNICSTLYIVKALFDRSMWDTS